MGHEWAVPSCRQKWETGVPKAVKDVILGVDESAPTHTPRCVDDIREWHDSNSKAIVDSLIHRRDIDFKV
jgi:hypothetical protein